MIRRIFDWYLCMIEFAGATPHFDAIGPYRLEYCFIDKCFVF